MSQTTVNVAYVGPVGRGVVIQETDQRVRPKGSPSRTVPDPETGEPVEVPDRAEVPIELAVRLCRQDIWEGATSRDAKTIRDHTSTEAPDPVDDESTATTSDDTGDDAGDQEE